MCFGLVFCVSIAGGLCFDPPFFSMSVSAGVASDLFWDSNLMPLGGCTPW